MMKEIALLLVIILLPLPSGQAVPMIGARDRKAETAQAPDVEPEHYVLPPIE